jgi:beta-galactosidase
MYQTQRRALEAFKADVPDGMYSVYLHWAELIKPMADILVYNLGKHCILEETSDRTFSVSVNGKCIYERLNVLEAVGPARPLVVKVDVKVENGEGLTIDLKPITGETMLTAVRIVKMN